MIAPWHPASKKLNPVTKVAVLSDNPLRSELPYWGFPVNQILTGEIEGSLKHCSNPSRTYLQRQQ